MNNPLSFSSVKLDLFSRDGARLKQASGFILEADNRYYLITNWHVLSGKDFAREQQEPVVQPFTLKTSLHIQSGEGKHNAPFPWGMRKRITVPLYDEHNIPARTEPRANQKGQPVADVAALPIQVNETLRFNQRLNLYVRETLVKDMYIDFWSRISAIPISAIDTNVEYSPPDAVHIIGYPLGWAPDRNEWTGTAFWKTSTIATEIYEIGISRRAYTFFIDPCAPEGMTGSPVLGMKKDQLKLLGVYSNGSTAEFGVHAGLVWDAMLMKKLIETP